ncbi:MAG: hypothetical protein HZB99_00090 [Candidatus Harrisonbacteria bacterium]|nr:hypothetical protein [Candidatus Harrisonbacteria bacterium]
MEKPMRRERPPVKLRETPEEAAMRARIVADMENEQKRAQAEKDREEVARLQRLGQQAAAEEAGPHIITAEDAKEAEKMIGKESEKLK